MSQQTVVLKVGMSCGGCAGAVKRVLTNMEGVETFDIDLEQKKVTVKGNVDPDAVFQTVSKTGKKTEFWPKEASPAACCSGPAKKPAEPPAVLAEPLIEAVEQPVTAPSCGVEKPVEPVVVAPPSCEATKPIEPPSSEVEKPVEPVVAPFSKAENKVEATVV